ncbi:MAG: aldose 1-epimerase family protein [Ruminococcaceae bacterium]|nr:aldose 1-epimerase family protein [Oscillospiraceae bacterium]
MFYTLQNDKLTVKVSDVGAEIHSVRREDCEYIWVGDPAFWSSHAPLLFPVCGRFFEGKYTHKGEAYEIACHGFIRKSPLTLVCVNDTSICFSVTSTEETKKIYPFDFELKIWHILKGESITTRFEIANTGEVVLPATVGGHPGFNLPLGGEGEFADYYLEFKNPCTPNQIEISPRGLFTGKLTAYPLVDGNKLPLSHKLFEIDGIFLSRMDSTVTLKSDKSTRAVTLEYPDMPYLGIWHPSACEAPFVCIEPWCGLPGYDGTMEDITTRPNMFHILPGKVQTAQFKMTFH